VMLSGLAMTTQQGAVHVAIIEFFDFSPCTLPPPWAHERACGFLFRR